MSCRTETFRVAGEQPVKRRLCRTVHGPVQARSAPSTAWARRYATWQHEMDTLVGLAELNEADTVADAGRALNKVSWNENTMLADDQGNIGWWHPGRLPIRPKRWDERLPLPGTGSAEWRGFLRPSQRPHVINPDQGWLANWNNMPSVGWTVGDAPATERTNGRLHRGAYLMPLVRDGGAGAELRRDQGRRPRGRHDGAAAPLLDARLRTAAAGATGAAKTVLDTIVAWDGNYDRTDAAGTVDPGVAAWEALKDAAVAHAAARGARLARRARPLARVRLRRRRRRGVPAARRGRPAAGRRGGRDAARLERPGYLARAATDVRRDRARPRREAGFEVLRPRHLAAGRRARPLELHWPLVNLRAAEHAVGHAPAGRRDGRSAAVRVGGHDLDAQPPAAVAAGRDVGRPGGA